MLIYAKERCKLFSDSSRSLVTGLVWFVKITECRMAQFLLLECFFLQWCVYYRCGGDVAKEMLLILPIPWAPQSNTRLRTDKDIEMMLHELDIRGTKTGKLPPIITLGKRTMVSSVHPPPATALFILMHFFPCLIRWFYGQNALRMVYNGTNCAEMSCMRNLCKALAMLLPESI